MLEDTGVDVIDPTGERFDPERMEAMLRVPVDSEEQDEQVAQVFQKGYSLKGVLVRPARVSVYKRG
jgi:molecular chaperone GrpE